MNAMGVFALMLIFGLFSSDLPLSSAQSIFNVLNYGAKADGKTDDSKAFLEAWEAACSAKTQNSTVLVPSSKDFLVYPLNFTGPCKSSHITFQLLGTINAPSSPSVWTEREPRDARGWLSFIGVTGLLITGEGTINGHGSEWWDLSCSDHPDLAGCASIIPMALSLISCQRSTISDIYSIDSAKFHIVVNQSSDILVENIHITAPESSPNTDGIHVEISKNVLVNNSIIGTGDDCVSIGDSTSNVTVSYIKCGPGHGVSIGSLGRFGTSAKVENINVKRIDLKGTTNGVRIKTWQIGTGYARNISFEHITLQSVKNPIYINQYYCDITGGLGNCKQKSTGVRISEVTYNDIVGTSSSRVAINFNCSQSVACTGISLSSIQIKSEKPEEQVISNCINAHGTDSGVEPRSCLLS